MQNRSFDEGGYLWLKPFKFLEANIPALDLISTKFSIRRNGNDVFASFGGAVACTEYLAALSEKNLAIRNV